jgi:hypothetical protein
LSKVEKVQDFVVRCTGTALVLLKKDAVLSEAELIAALKDTGHGVVKFKEAPPPAGIPLGGKLPREVLEIKLQSVDGKDLTLTRVRGRKGILVVFTSNACPTAKFTEARLSALGNEFARKEIGVMAVNPNNPAASVEDSLQATKDRAKTAGFAFPTAVDPAALLAGALGAMATPEAFLFDGEGQLVYRGSVDDGGEKPTRHYLKDALEALLAGKPVPVPRTLGNGCEIKSRQEPAAPEKKA